MLAFVFLLAPPRDPPSSTAEQQQKVFEVRELYKLIAAAWFAFSLELKPQKALFSC